MKAAGIYGDQVGKMKLEAGDGNIFLGPWTGKKIDDWTPDVRRREAELLREIRRLDLLAKRQIDEALNLREQIAV